MKGYYILFGDKVKVNIQNKIDMQLDELRKHCDITYITSGSSYSNEKLSKMLFRIPLFNFPRFDFDRVFDQLEEPDFIYFRRVSTDNNLIRFLMRVKTAYPNCKIIIELFSYPYYKDIYFNRQNIILLPKEVLFNKRYKKYVDRFVTYSRDTEIFGVKTIPIMNGIDTEQFGVITPRPTDEEIHMLAVAMFQKHHGYERIIEGLHEYYAGGGKRNIKLLMVGEGPEIPKYKELIANYNLNEHVVFYGKLQGEELNKVYNDSDIGLGSFGFYKIGLTLASSLKTREYLAKGLPLVAGCEQDMFPDGSGQYYLEFPNNDSVVDLQKILNFFDSIYSKADRREIANKIHRFAKNTVSMAVAFKPVVDYLTGHKHDEEY